MAAVYIWLPFYREGLAYPKVPLLDLSKPADLNSNAMQCFMVTMANYLGLQALNLQDMLQPNSNTTLIPNFKHQQNCI